MKLFILYCFFRLLFHYCVSSFFYHLVTRVTSQGSRRPLVSLLFAYMFLMIFFVVLVTLKVSSASPSPESSQTGSKTAAMSGNVSSGVGSSNAIEGGVANSSGSARRSGSSFPSRERDPNGEPP